MRDTDRLLVIEMLTVPCEPNPGLAMLDMMMLYSARPVESVAEYEELFGAARFELTRVLPTLSAFGIVEARPV